MLFVLLPVNSGNSNIINILQNSFMKFNEIVKFWVLGCSEF